MECKQLFSQLWDAIESVRQVITPLNQESSFREYSESAKRFRADRSNLAPLSPRSRAKNIIDIGGGHCWELAAALQVAILEKLPEVGVAICETNTQEDHVFCLVEAYIDELETFAYIEVDAWHPRIQIPSFVPTSEEYPLGLMSANSDYKHIAIVQNFLSSTDQPIKDDWQLFTPSSFASTLFFSHIEKNERPYLGDIRNLGIWEDKPLSTILTLETYKKLQFQIAERIKQNFIEVEEDVKMEFENG
jgi:hypothetical protein